MPHKSEINAPPIKVPPRAVFDFAGAQSSAIQAHGNAFAHSLLETNKDIVNPPPSPPFVSGKNQLCGEEKESAVLRYMRQPKKGQGSRSSKATLIRTFSTVLVITAVVGLGIWALIRIAGAPLAAVVVSVDGQASVDDADTVNSTGVVESADARLPYVIVDDTFNNGDKEGWTGVTVVDLPSAADKSIQVLSTGIKRKFAEQASRFEVCFDLLPTANVKLYILDRQDRTVMYFRTMSDGRLRCSNGRNGGSKVLELGRYIQPTWVNLMATVDMISGNFTITVDGVEVGSADLPDALQPVDRVRVKLKSAASVLIDNFKITSDTPPFQA